jgi:Domain of unknown function (DUF4214)
VAEGIKNPPKMTEKERVESVVRKTFFAVLNRHPDKAGLDNYTGQILSGALLEQNLVGALKGSDEYVRDHPAPQPSQEAIKVPVTVEMNVKVDEGSMAAQWMQTRHYTGKWKPMLDVGSYITDNVSPEFFTVYYEWQAKEGPGARFEDFVKLLGTYSSTKGLSKK